MQLPWGPASRPYPQPGIELQTFLLRLVSLQGSLFLHLVMSLISTGFLSYKSAMKTSSAAMPLALASATLVNQSPAHKKSKQYHDSAESVEFPG